MGKLKVSSSGVLLIAAVAAAGGIYLLDLCVLEPHAYRQKKLALRQEGIRAARASTRVLDTEARRLEGICSVLTADVPDGMAALIRRAPALSGVDAIWRVDGQGRIGDLWWRDDLGPGAEEIAESLGNREAIEGSSGEVGLLSIGLETVVLARSGIPPGETGAPAEYLYVARRLAGGLLTAAGEAIPGQLLWIPQTHPSGVLTGNRPTRPTVFLAEDGQLAAMWGARDVRGRTRGYFRADLAIPPALAQQSHTRRSILLVLSLSAIAILLTVLGASVLLARPMARMVRRLQRVESGQGTIEDVSRGLRGEGLVLARKLQKALAAMSILSRTDEMTGLPNRRQFDEALHRAVHQARRHGQRVSAMVMDIDLFKAINDTKGHQAGDEVIKVVAGIMKRVCRQSDLPARLGGDEFGVLLPETSSSDAAVVAERIRKSVLDRTVMIDGSEVNMTVSIGIADLEAGRIDSPEDLTALADEALYAAKQLGRNRFVQAHEINQDDWVVGGNEADRVEVLRGKLAGLDTQFKSLFVRALQEIVQVMERRDPMMADCARKVQHYSTIIGRKLGLSEELIKQIELAALVHDIGMLALPDSIALCHGRLNPEQVETMRQHTLIGARILDGTEFIEQAIPVARFHHEWFDGTGYPDGLSGLGIPPICRIVAVADAFNAMTSQRSFRDKMPIAQAFKELRDAAGTQFDPEMVDAFIDAAEKLGDKLTDVPLPKAAGTEADQSADEPADEPADEAVSRGDELLPVS